MKQKISVTTILGNVQLQRKKNLYSTIIDVPAASKQLANQLRKAADDMLEKAKEMPIGTISMHGGVKMKKTGPKKWIPVAEDKAGSQPADVEALEVAITDVLLNDSMKQSDKVRALLTMGIEDKKVIAEMTGANYSRVHQLKKKHDSKKGVQPSTLSKEQQVVAVHNLPSEVQEAMPTLTVDERWESYELFVDMVATGMSKSCIAFGTGGVGKTYVMTQILKKNNLREFRVDQNHEVGGDEYDYVSITGKATPVAMYKALYEHNGKLIVFDDCDSVLQDETSVNLFKGALDTSGSGTVTYGSSKKIKTTVGEYTDEKDNLVVPPRFDFTGRVIFISNLKAEQMPQPLIDSRALAVDLSMSIEDTVQRLKDISHLIPINNIDGTPLEGITKEDRDDVVALISKHSKQMRPGKLNARTFLNLVKIKSKLKDHPTMDWKKAALTMLS